MGVINSNRGDIYTLGCDTVIELHSLLSTHPELVEITEPVEPPGIKNRGNLESAVSRQETNLGGIYKYPNRYLSCATLVFGITKSHAFHNGNKRAGFLSMIKHLYVNNLVIKPNVKHNEIYNLLTSIASNLLEKFAQNKKYKKQYRSIKKKYDTWSDDAIVEFIALWIQLNTESKSKFNRNIKWRKLIPKLRQLGLEVNPEPENNKICISQGKSIFGGLFSKKRTSIFSYHGESCNIRILKAIRNEFGLTPDQGIDNNQFFSEDIVFDTELTIYKMIIYRLSLT